MKSGTNWIGRILKTHPEVDCVGEYHWESFLYALRSNIQRIAPKRQDDLAEVVRPELEKMVKRCLESFSSPKATVIGDRTPTTVDPVVMSDAPHIVLVRDFRDVIVSRLFHLYSKPRVTGVFEKFSEMKHRRQQFQQDTWFFRDHPEELLANEEIVRDSAREWAAHQVADRAIESSNPSLRVKFLRYEDLHAHFDQQVESAFDFLGLKPPAEIPEILRPGHDAERPDQLNRKGIVGDWRNYMTDHAKQWINEEAGQELIRQGYIDSETW